MCVRLVVHTVSVPSIRRLKYLRFMFQAQAPLTSPFGAVRTVKGHPFLRRFFLMMQQAKANPQRLLTSVE